MSDTYDLIVGRDACVRVDQTNPLQILVNLLLSFVIMQYVANSMISVIGSISEQKEIS